MLASLVIVASSTLELDLVGDDGLEPPTYRVSQQAFPTSLMAPRDSMPEVILWP